MENTLEKIYKSGLKFLNHLTPEETYSTVVEEAVKLLDAKYGSILLEDQGGFKVLYSSHPLGYQTKRRKRANTYRAFTERKIIVAHISDVGRAHPEVRAHGIQWTIYAPLSYRGKSIGVLTLNSTRDQKFTNKELNILKLFCSMASLAIRKTQLYSETKKALETRELFISMAAHELRTPLTTIHGYVQLLRSKMKSDTSALGRWVEELSWETTRLTHLVNELLEVNRIKNGELQYVWREHSLKEIVNRALMDFRFTNPHRKIIFQDQLGERGDLVVGDFDKLLQVAINLLENAVKFSSPEKDVIVTLKFKHPNIIFQVEDYGRGIARKEIPKIFNSFYQTGKQHQGMGIGLFLAKNIIEEHHGIISVRSRVNKGTTVEVKLPQAKI